MKYYVSCKVFNQGHLIDSYDLDNQGQGYNLKAAQKIREEKDDVVFDGPAQGTEATVYGWDGKRA